MLLKKLLAIMLLFQISFASFGCTPSPKYLSRHRKKKKGRITGIEASSRPSVYSKTPLSPPVVEFRESMVVGPYGIIKDPLYGTEEFNSGIDIVVRCGQFVISSGDGTVAYSGVQGGFGKIVIVDHGHRLCTVYARLDTSFVETGDAVRKGEAIGKPSADGGGSCIFHYEVRSKGKPLDPLDFMR